MRWPWRRRCAEHRWELVERTGWATPTCGRSKCVADWVKQRALQCQRCEATARDWQTIDTSCVRRFTLDPVAMDDFLADGFLLNVGPVAVPLGD